MSESLDPLSTRPEDLSIAPMELAPAAAAPGTEQNLASAPPTPRDGSAISAKSLTDGLKGLFLDVAKVVIAILVIWHFVAHPSVVKGQSMEPTFHNDDRLMVDLLTYRFSAIERGDVVVLKNPGRPKEDFIKRVIGLPGEYIEIVNGVVRIGDKPLEEPYLKSLEKRSFRKQKVPPAHYFVLGDNRDLSKDSRDSAVGWIPADYIRGKIRFRFWPIDQIQIF